MSNDPSDRKYCGNGKVIKTQYGELMKLSLTEADVQSLQESLDNGWVNIVVKERRNPSPTGLTHYLEIDTWKPNEKDMDNKPAPAKKSAPAAKDPFDDDEISVDDLPF